MSPEAVYTGELLLTSRRDHDPAVGRRVAGGLVKWVLATRVSMMRRSFPLDLATKNRPHVAVRPAARVNFTMFA